MKKFLKNNVRKTIYVLLFIISLFLITNTQLTLAENSNPEMISVSSGNIQGNNRSYHFPSVSLNGDYVAFVSEASNLVPDDNNGREDIFVRNRLTGETERISVSSTGAEALNGYSLHPVISENGQFVAFYSGADNLVPDDTNGVDDIFIHDRNSGETDRISVSTLNAQSNGDSDFPAISSDGRYVTFRSAASNLVTGDTNNTRDVFIHDRDTGTTSRVSVSSSNTEGNSRSHASSVSTDGRFVAFESEASNLISGDNNGQSDIFLRDIVAGTTISVSQAISNPVGSRNSFEPVMTQDGKYVACRSSVLVVTGLIRCNQ